MNITNFIFQLSKSVLIKDIALFLSYVYLPLMPIFLLYFMVKKSATKMKIFSLIFLTGFSSWLISETIKNLLKIERPLTNGLFYLEKGYSMPSTHTMIAIALAIVLYSVNRKLGLIAILLAILVGISRVVLGVHSTIDVLVGLIIGSIISFLFIRIFKKV